MLTNSRYNHTPPLPVACQLETETLFLLQNNTLTPYLITVNAEECFDSQLFLSKLFVLIPVDVYFHTHTNTSTRFHKESGKTSLQTARSISKTETDFKRTSNFLGK